jgi:hypothetical protein
MFVGDTARGYEATGWYGIGVPKGRVSDALQADCQSQVRQGDRVWSKNWYKGLGSENSLFFEDNSLLRLQKFPVLLRREFGSKTLNSLDD